MNTVENKKGSATVFAIIGVVVVGLVIFYFVSDPFSTRVDQVASQATEWTPENIQKDPVGYLTWALKETGKTEQQLNASALSLRTKQNQADRQLTAKSADLSNYTKLLEEMKQAYKDAAANSAWPANVRGIQMEEAVLKGKVVESNDKINQLNELVGTYQKTKSVIGRKLGEVEQKLTEIRKLQNQLSTDLEIAKVNKSVEGIGDINDKLMAIMDTSSALANDSGDISLDDLVSPSNDQMVDDEFSKIMGM